MTFLAAKVVLLGTREFISNINRSGDAGHLELEEEVTESLEVGEEDEEGFNNKQVKDITKIRPERKINLESVSRRTSLNFFVEED